MNASGLDTVLSALRGENAGIGGEKSAPKGENAEFLAAFDAASRAAEAPKSTRTAAPAPSYQQAEKPLASKAGENGGAGVEGGKPLPTAAADTASQTSVPEASSTAVTTEDTATPEQGEPASLESNSGEPASKPADNLLAAWVRSSEGPQGQPAESASTVAKAVHQALEARADTLGGAPGGSRDGSLPSNSPATGAVSAGSGEADAVAAQARNRDFVAAVREAVAGVEPRGQGATQSTGSTQSAARTADSNPQPVDGAAGPDDAVATRGVPATGTNGLRATNSSGVTQPPVADAELESGSPDPRVTRDSMPAASTKSTDAPASRPGADVSLAARESGSESARSSISPPGNTSDGAVKGVEERDAPEQRIARFANALRSPEQTAGRAERPQPGEIQQNLPRGLSGQVGVADDSTPMRSASGLERFIVDGEAQPAPGSANRTATPAASNFGLSTASAATTHGEVRSNDGVAPSAPTLTASMAATSPEAGASDVTPDEVVDVTARAARDGGPAPESTAAQRGFEGAFAQASASQPQLGRGMETSNTPVPTLPDMASTPDSNEFPQELLGRLRLLQSQGTHEARLNLHPAELGRMQISITTEGDTARVAFTVDNAQARDALEQAMPRLRELLGQAGLQLADSTVSQQGEQQSRESTEDSGSRLAASGSEGEPEDGTDEPGRGRGKPDPERAIDAYV